MDCIHNFLKRQFYLLGIEVGKSPKYFTAISLLVFLFLASGISKLKFNSDTEYLFTVENSKTKSDRDLIENYFFTSSLISEDFDPSRLTRPGRFAKLIVAPKDEKSVMTPAIWKEVTELDNMMHVISCNHNGQNYNYSRICAKKKNKCFENGILKNYHSDNRVVEEESKSKAITLEYYISVKSYDDDLRGEKWESAVIKNLHYRDDKWININVSRLTFKTLSEEPEINTLKVVQYIPVIIIFIIIFTIATCMGSERMESKSLVGFMGIISSVLGASGACGLLGYLGVDFIGINLAVPFITLGIGLDDTFLMISSWRRTSRFEPISNRLAECYSESATSISITTITDVLSFSIGVLSPIPSIRIFSTYAFLCIFFIFICHIFFFGAIIAINASFEDESSEFIPNQVQPTVEPTKTKGVDKPDASISVKNIETNMENPLNEKYATIDIFIELLHKKHAKNTILFLYIMYIVASLYGLNQLKDGLLRENLARYDSYMSEYFVKEREHFPQQSHKIQVVITSPLDYYSNSTESKISFLLEELVKDEYLSDEPQDNWLKEFSAYVEHNQLNITSNSDFILALKNLLLQNSSVGIARDVVFNEASTDIIASRFIVQSRGINDVSSEKSVYNNIQKVLGNPRDFQVAVYHQYFDFIELHIITSELTIKLLGLASLIVMLVSFFILPSVLGSLCVSLSVISIELGVLGFMSLWSIRLDLISLLCLIMSIGFSVDFSFHVAYSLITCAKTIPDTTQRLKHTIRSLGFPVLQGAASTLIGVSALAIVPSYIFQTFFKIVFLVMTFSVFHAIFILPIALSAIKPLQLTFKKQSYQVST